MSEPQAEQRRTAFAALAIACLCWLWVVFAGIFAIGAAVSGMWIAAILLATSAAAAVPPWRDIFFRYGVGKSALPLVALLSGFAGIIALAVTAPTPPTVTSPTARAAPATEPDRSEKETAKADLEQLWRQMISRTRPCDTAQVTAGKSVEQYGGGNASVYDAYSSVKDAQAACEQASGAIEDLAAPTSLTEAQQQAVSKTLDTCRMAYSIRAKAMAKLMTFLDGDDRPSVMDKIKDGIDAGTSGSVLCAAQMVAAGTAVDAKIEL